MERPAQARGRQVHFYCRARLSFHRVQPPAAATKEKNEMRSTRERVAETLGLPYYNGVRTFSSATAGGNDRMRARYGCTTQAHPEDRPVHNAGCSRSKLPDSQVAG